MSDRLMFVQFPHPGAEHRPKSAVMPWNRHNHARKFLKIGGQYCADGKIQFVHQVVDQAGLALGVRLDTPARAGRDTPTQSISKIGC